jgi:hypothetical protein
MHCVDRGFCHVLIGVILFCCVFVLPLRTEKYLTSGTHCNWFWSFLVPGSSWFHYVFVLHFALFMVLFLKHMVSLYICIGVSFVQGLVPSSTWFLYAIVLKFVLFILLFPEARGFTMYLYWSLFCSSSCSLKHVVSLYLYWNLFCSWSCSQKHVVSLCICFVHPLDLFTETRDFTMHL